MLEREQSLVAWKHFQCKQKRALQRCDEALEGSGGQEHSSWALRVPLGGGALGKRCAREKVPQGAVLNCFEIPKCLQKSGEDRSSGHWIWPEEVILTLRAAEQSRPPGMGVRGEDEGTAASRAPCGLWCSEACRWSPRSLLSFPTMFFLGACLCLNSPIYKSYLLRPALRTSSWHLQEPYFQIRSLHRSRDQDSNTCWGDKSDPHPVSFPNRVEPSPPSVVTAHTAP